MKLIDVYNSLINESLLAERLTNIDDDVNLLYDRYFRETVDTIERTGVLNRSMFPKDQTNTAILKTPECVEANSKNMCIIYINSGTNSYSPNKREINISFSREATEFIISDCNGDLRKAINLLDTENRRNSLRNEFTEARIKGSIHHELSHWLDDTMNNRHIEKKLVSMANEPTKNQDKPINASKIEIQGQIYNIKQLYNKHKGEWDELTFNDILRLSPPLNVINRQLKGDIRTNWLRDLKSRMHREGLLGKNMINN